MLCTIYVRYIFHPTQSRICRYQNSVQWASDGLTAKRLILRWWTSVQYASSRRVICGQGGEWIMETVRVKPSKRPDIYKAGPPIIHTEHCKHLSNRRNTCMTHGESLACLSDIQCMMRQQQSATADNSRYMYVSRTPWPKVPHADPGRKRHTWTGHTF